MSIFLFLLSLHRRLSTQAEGLLLSHLRDKGWFRLSLESRTFWVDPSFRDDVAVDVMLGGVSGWFIRELEREGRAVEL
jgi:hypothetical protein